METLSRISFCAEADLNIIIAPFQTVKYWGGLDKREIARF